MSIKENYQKIRKNIPDNVTIVVVAKTRTSDEIIEAIKAGVTDIGQNYLQEAEIMQNSLGPLTTQIKLHMIGNLQTKKINRILKNFEILQTIDSYEKAEAINQRIKNSKKNKFPVYIQINIGNEITKSGIMPEYPIIENLIRKISCLENLIIEGLMIIEPAFKNPENARPYFKKTKEIFEKIKALNLPNVNMKTLSMGMSNSYQIAIEEGSNMIRLGTIIFGERK